MRERSCQAGFHSPSVTSATRAQTLPAPLSDLGQQLLKDPYNFGFLTLGQAA